jgi:L-alanine-DL-glutamate epimerase-like enolase superfamily enzyme
MTAGPFIGHVTVRAFTVPTDRPESDGTLAWDRTTLVLVEAGAGGRSGLGYTYASTAAREVVRDQLAPAVAGRDAFDVPGAWDAMLAAVRNLGSRGVCACAISAVDMALWDLKARLLGLPLAGLLGRRRDEVPVYGSGGFTSYDDRTLREQLAGWAHEGGCGWVKMKVGRDPPADLDRVKAARQAIGPDTGLFVDANGAFDARTAIQYAELFSTSRVVWFEEPVSSDDLAGLKRVRRRCPAQMQVAAGEYGFDPFYFRRMLEAECVDVLQADVTRCLGVTGFLMAADLTYAFSLPLSGHCAPAAHLHAACAAPRLRHLEWFHDHVRIESMLFDGAPTLEAGVIRPDLSRPGLGLELRAADAKPYEV